MATMNDYVALKADFDRLRAAAKALAERTLKYVGPDDDPKLECDAEMRRLARATLEAC